MISGWVLSWSTHCQKFQSFLFSQFLRMMKIVSNVSADQSSFKSTVFSKLPKFVLFKMNVLFVKLNRIQPKIKKVFWKLKVQIHQNTFHLLSNKEIYQKVIVLLLMFRNKRDLDFKKTKTMYKKMGKWKFHNKMKKKKMMIIKIILGP